MALCVFFSSQCFITPTSLAAGQHSHRSAVRCGAEAFPDAIATTNTAVAMENVLCFNIPVHITTSLRRTDLHGSGYMAKTLRHLFHSQPAQKEPQQPRQPGERFRGTL